MSGVFPPCAQLPPSPCRDGSRWCTLDEARDTDDLLDERELVEQARSDVEAFATIYRRYVDKVYRFVLRRTGDVGLAEDITATTLEKGARSPRSVPLEGRRVRTMALSDRKQRTH